MGVRSKIINIGCAKGFIDKSPTFMKERQRILDIIDIIYKRHGAEKLETPVFELKDIFANKQRTCNKLLDLDDQGGEILAMRYDLKHPLTRYLSMNKIEKHMKISQSGYVYRKEKIDLEKFRLREFFVSDFDICGPTDAMVSEAQCLRICCDIIKALELNEPIKILIGHKKITESFLRIAAGINDSQAVKLINKVAEDNIRSGINWNTALNVIGDKKITESVVNSFRDLIKTFSGGIDEVLSRIQTNEQLISFKETKPVINELIQLHEFCRSFLNETDYCKIHLDFNLIGSSNFYTGLVFAAQLDSNGMNLLSGGRYDNLISKINPKSKDKIGCTGFSIGVDQLVYHQLANKGLTRELFCSESRPNDIDETGDLTQSLAKTKIAVKKEKNEKDIIEDNLLKNVKGTIDRVPQQMLVREQVFDVIINCFKRYNAGTIDTPVVERNDVLTGKYGEDSKLIYDLNDVDNERLSLRYDLTVPFARYLAMHNNVFDKDPLFKRYQIGKVYRRDNPSISRGRYREFYQCDFDIAGQVGEPMKPDFECLSVVYEILRDLNLGDYRIKVNHRKFLDGLMAVCGVPDDMFRTICSSIDKLDKTPWEKVHKEMLDKGLSSSSADKIGEYVGFSGGIDLIDKLEAKTELMANENVQIAMKDLRILFGYCSNIMDKIQLDLSLARGLDYYTGVVFEAVFTEFESKPQDESEEDNQISVGSVSGGGRYDNLVNMFSESDEIIPCVGLSIGVERLMAICEKIQGSDISATSKKQVMVITAQKNMIEERFKLLSMILDAGITATHSMKKNPKALDVFQECERMKIPLAVIIGEDELKENSVKLRYIESRKEEMVPQSEILNRLKSELGL